MTLKRIAEDVWVATHPQRFWRVETGTRTTLVRVRDGGLFVHWPVALFGATPLLEKNVPTLREAYRWLPGQPRAAITALLGPRGAAARPCR